MTIAAARQAGLDRNPYPFEARQAIARVLAAAILADLRQYPDAPPADDPAVVVPFRRVRVRRAA